MMTHAEAQRRYRERHPERARADRRRWKMRYPDQVSAHKAVANAVRDGRLVRKPCEICGNDDVEGHHEDYMRPLDVRWLCKQHHEEVHHQGGE